MIQPNFELLTVPVRVARILQELRRLHYLYLVVSCKPDREREKGGGKEAEKGRGRKEINENILFIIKIRIFISKIQILYF